MIELIKGNRHILEQLHYSKEEVCIVSCVEGIMGRAWVDKLDAPLYGLVAVADFCFLLGEPPVAKDASLVALLKERGKNQIISFDSERWSELIKEHFPENHKSLLRYAFYWEPERFDRAQLEKYLEEADNTFPLVPFDDSLFNIAIKDDFTADFCLFYETPEVFKEKGIGYAFVKDNEIIAGASSYSSCNGAIDITIGTIDAYRRKGLALACASKLILACMDRGIYPKWEAANLGSVALAEKLGYRYKGEYTVYTIR